MPFKKLTLRPGVNVQQSPTLNQTQFAKSNLIRFYAGLIQKLGGWAQVTSQLFTGVCRGLHGWADINGNGYLAVGTTTNLYVYVDQTATLSSIALAPIPPYVPVTTNPAVNFSTIAGSSLVTIVDAGYSPVVGQPVYLNATQVSVGGLIIFGSYVVVSVISATTYSIDVGTPAPLTQSNTGAVPAFQTFAGSNEVQVTLPYNQGGLGSTFTILVPTTVGGLTLSGNYNVNGVSISGPYFNPIQIQVPTVAASNATASENGGNVRITYGPPPGHAGPGQIPVTLVQWSLDNWGQDLIASQTNAGIYFWVPPTIAAANIVSPTAPLYNTTIFVMSQIQIIVALGAEINGQQEPLLVRWCNAGDFTDWTPTAANQAGSYQIPTGTKLIAGLAVGLGALLWTDVDLWSMTYEGLPFVFGFNRVAASCGILAQRAVGVAGTLVMWISISGFFNYSVGGGANPMECPLWDFFINNVDQTLLAQIHCAPNPQFNEFAWHFPLLTSSPYYSVSTPFAYVKFNYIENAWDYGCSAQYQRTAWVGRSALRPPVGADLTGLLQQHEVGTDANGQGMAWSWQSGFFDLTEGEDYPFVDMLIPDSVTTGNPTIEYTVYQTLYSGVAPTAIGPFAWTPSTTFIPLRARGRQMAIGASGSDLGTFNRLGAFRLRYAPDGRN